MILAATYKIRASVDCSTDLTTNSAVLITVSMSVTKLFPRIVIPAMRLPEIETGRVLSCRVQLRGSSGRNFWTDSRP